MNEIYSNLITRVSLVIAPFFIFGLINGIYNSALATTTPWLFWFTDMLGWLVLPSVILFYIHRYYGIGLRDYGLIGWGNRRQRLEVMNWSLLATFMLSIYYFSFGWLAWEFIDVSIPTFTYSQMVPEGGAYYLTVFYLAATAAIFEEIFYRGLIWRLVFSSATTVNKSLVYVAISSILFGLVHWENGLPEIFSATIFGIVACIIYLRQHNLIPLIIAHFCIDMINFW